MRGHREEPQDLLHGTLDTSCLPPQGLKPGRLSMLECFASKSHICHVFWGKAWSLPCDIKKIIPGIDLGPRAFMFEQFDPGWCRDISSHSLNLYIHGSSSKQEHAHERRTPSGYRQNVLRDPTSLMLQILHDPIDAILAEFLWFWHIYIYSHAGFPSSTWI